MFMCVWTVSSFVQAFIGAKQALDPQEQTSVNLNGNIELHMNYIL